MSDHSLHADDLGDMATPFSPIINTPPVQSAIPLSSEAPPRTLVSPHAFVSDDSGDATTVTVAVAAPVTGSDDAAGAATRANQHLINAVNHDRHCTLTIGEAQDLFKKLLRRPLSERSLQRYCNDGTLFAQLISHSQGKEWLINEPSLMRFVESRPIVLPGTPLASLDVDDMEPLTATVATPRPAFDDHTFETGDTVANATAPSTDMASPSAPKHPDTGDTIERHPSNHNDNGGASDDFADNMAAGEHRKFGSMLIENARLTALLEGKQEVIETLKSNDGHLRDELKESKTLISKLTSDVTRIASQMLQTMQAIGTAGKGVVTLDSTRPIDPMDEQPQPSSRPYPQ